MKTTTINISLPETLLDAADKQAETELRNRSELIRESLRTYLISKSGGSEDSFTKEEVERAKRILDFSNLKKERVVVLSSVLRPQPNKIVDIFGGIDSPITKLMENPPSFRNSGWDLQTLDRAKPVAGEYLEAVNGDRKILRLYRDGQIVFSGDEGFFGHGANKDDDEPQMNKFSFNGLGIAEAISNFTNFSFQMANFSEETVNKIIFKIEIFNPNKTALGLKNIVRNFPWPESVGEMHLDFAQREIVIPVTKDSKFEKAAYAILSELFFFFGLSEDRFWYVNKETKEVDINFFKEKLNYANSYILSPPILV